MGEDAALASIYQLSAARLFVLDQSFYSCRPVSSQYSLVAATCDRARTLMYKHILIPTDGSLLSADAIEHGMALAKAVSAKVTALTVSTALPSFAPGSENPGTVSGAGQHEPRASDRTNEYLIVATQAAAALGISCNALRVEHEHPYQAIIDTAEQLECDAIVMASHGRRGVSALVLGSETAKVLTHSTIPVIVVRGQPPGAFFAAS